MDSKMTAWMPVQHNEITLTKVFRITKVIMLYFIETTHFRSHVSVDEDIFRRPAPRYNFRPVTCLPLLIYKYSDFVRTLNPDISQK